MRCSCWIILFATGSLLAGEPTTAIAESVDWLSGDYATGDWGGKRKWLEDRGVKLEAVYMGEVQSNTRGGLNTNNATECLGSVDVTAKLDFEKLVGHKGGTLFLWFTDVHGEGISEDHVGDSQLISNLEARPFRTLYEYWYKQEFFDGRFWVLGGRFDANVNFAATDIGGNFIHSSFGHPPNIPFGTFPNTGVGMQAGFKINDWASFQAMIQDGKPNENSVGGWHHAFSSDHVACSIFEFQYKPQMLPKSLPGTYKFGVWQHSADFPEISNAENPRSFTMNYGLYFIADQQVYKERPQDEKDNQGLALFAQFARAPEDRNEVEAYVGGGVLYTGAIKNRDSDKCGFGVAHAKFSDRLHKRNETAFELFYHVQVTKFISVQPSVEYIANPSGRRDLNDAIAAGLRFEVKF